MRRSTVSVAIAIALGVSVLASCGRGGGSDETAAQNAVTTIGTAPATGTVTVWAMGAEGEALDAFVADFEEANPDVDVQVTAIPWDSAHDKIQTAIAAGNGPDVSQIGSTWIADFADSFTTVPSDLDTSDLFSGSLETATIGGTQLVVPWYVDTRVVYYRTDIASQAGWDKAPTTWEEFHDMAADMQKVDGVDYGLRLFPAGTDAFQNTLWAPWSNGASLTNAENTEWTFDTPEMTEAFEYTSSFFTEGIADVNAGIEPGAAVADFVSGTTPMFIDGPSLAAQINELGGEGFESKYATAVLPTKVTGTSFVGGSDLAVFKDSDNQSAAWKLVQWLTQPEVQVNWYKATTDLPASQTAWDDPALTADDKLAAFGEQLNDTQAPPTVSTWAQVNSAGETVIEKINRGTISVSDGLAELQKQADTIGMG